MHIAQSELPFIAARRPALTLFLALALFSLQTSFSSRTRRLGGPAASSWAQSLAHKVFETRNHILAVTPLAGCNLRGEMQQTGTVDISGQMSLYTLALRIVQTGRSRHIKKQLDPGSRAIDLLPSRPAGP